MSVVREVLLRVWPRNTAKHAAVCSGQSVRTAEGWLSGRDPGASVVLRMAARNDRLRAELMRALEGAENGRRAVAMAADRRRGLGFGPGAVVAAGGGVAPRQGSLTFGAG